jgi:hypothetical protein
MQGLQKEIFRHPEHCRTWQDQGCLPEMQGEKGQTGHLALYDQDQPEKLIATLEFPGRSGVTTSSGAGPSSGSSLLPTATLESQTDLRTAYLRHERRQFLV